MKPVTICKIVVTMHFISIGETELFMWAYVVEILCMYLVNVI